MMEVARFLDWSMRAFSTTDLNEQSSEVTDAASEAPILITRQAEPRFVMMSFEHYQRICRSPDPRCVFAVGETPHHLADLFLPEIEKLSRSEDDDGR